MKIYGKVKHWLDDRGFGFVTRDDGQGVFVRLNGTVDGQPLQRGQQVEFEVVEDERGRPRGASVRRVDGPVQFA